MLFAYDSINPTHYSKQSESLNSYQSQKLHHPWSFRGKHADNNEVSESLIFSISHHREPMKFTTSRRINRIDMDGSYMIFGTGELKIKARKLDLSCNIGSFQSIYAWGKRSLPHLEVFRK
jgi:hypothetical protein